ncbi:MAG: KOW domain-containing RNA-binding protein [Oscillospiraceae bacterium]|jgi:ribosomal protein L14E/L6E/L27E|nr:KOW domain-containing RNA-binding protein [Oscillospiraceae bacterium]
MKESVFAVSVAGHDAGTLYLVVGKDKDRVLVADGKHHKQDNPKRKNLKHLRFVPGQAERLTGTDAEIRRILAALKSLEEVE